MGVENFVNDEDDINELIKSGSKEITLKEDIYLKETIIIDVDDVVIDGADHIINAHGKTQIFYITSNNVTLKNITFENANFNQHGGAIYNLKGFVKIINCNFKNNHNNMGDGGAIYNDNGNMIIEKCSFKENSAKFGGAIYNGNLLKIIRSDFEYNHSTRGPSIFNNQDSELKLEKCNFKRNEELVLSNDFEIYNMGTIKIEESQKELIEELCCGGLILTYSEDTNDKKTNSKPFSYLKFREKVNKDYEEKLTKEKTFHWLEEKSEWLLYKSRWLLSPMYLILILILLLILYKFVGDVVNFISIMGTLTDDEWIVHVLELLDLTLVANLVVIVAFSGYENFVSKIDFAENHIDRPSWMGRLDFSGLKLKIIGSVVAISLIELLQDFLNATSHVNPEFEFWRIMLHLTFVFTGLVFAGMEILSEKRHEMKNKDILAELKNKF